MHHDENLLQLIIDDLAPTQQLLELLKEESLALYGRDMPLLEEILARKQSLIVLLEQHGKKRSQILISLGLPADHDGLAQLASHSSVGDQLLSQSKELTQLLAQCQEANLHNGQSIQLQQATTANQLRILHGGEPPALYNAQGSTSRLVKPSTRSQA
ncbi:flagellar biosynthesis protein FlgN [Pseudomonas fluorescens]|uniref:Flagellar protein FlgN n=1 Tax=Pseudomonas lactucae TaxID=2813360 RepID=A0A9X0YBW5_9PSED|nr:flagellar protein FlgN [Pseudomonas lactucae]EFQ61767.1 flagella synthesis protein FlgN [Pseudomonas fluorescens WH6]OPA85375.1 flagellar biosynthesis protein FlgN [Pseudomonas fluorescens]MBN2976434.1 flagellar protein FlgN [Pseudomonas lactucae]OPA86382.1 flagellar biosynthesis protein FlgN [Pseudomonas fluorescens]OPB05943.1 flagellar biosynthesis protein FlgN [Pseudomonas fluorescens]